MALGMVLSMVTSVLIAQANTNTIITGKLAQAGGDNAGTSAAATPVAAVTAAKPFDIVWSGLWPCCAGQSSFNLSKFPVLQEKRLAILDTQFGLYEQSFPPLGLPQTVDLAAHKAKVAHDAAHDGGGGRNVRGGIIPAGKDMYCCIDWESYTPVIFDHGTAAHSGGCPGPYSRYSQPGSACTMFNTVMNASVALVRQKAPGLNTSAAAALAAAEFNAAAKAFWLATIEVAQSTRPDCHWGFYGKPETEDIVPPFVDAFDRQVGDAFQWMFDASTAIFPSTYMHYNSTTCRTVGGYNASTCATYNLRYVEAITREAQRVNAARGPGRKKLKVLPWVWYRYISDHLTLLEPADMHTALAGPGLAGADGLLFYEDGLSWGPSPKQKAENKIDQEFIDEVVGPTAEALYGK